MNKRIRIGTAAAAGLLLAAVLFCPSVLAQEPGAAEDTAGEQPEPAPGSEPVPGSEPASGSEPAPPPTPAPAEQPAPATAPAAEPSTPASSAPATAQPPPALAASADDSAGDDAGDSAPAAAPSLGIRPGTSETGSLILVEPPPPLTASTSAEEWNFAFHGFLRAPMRLGIGSDEEVAEGVEGGDKLHAPPRIPDGTYTDWQYTGNLASPWAELRFSYGNSRVTAHVLIGAWNISDAGYRNLQAQLGINEAFLTLDFPRALGSRGGLVWNVGAFQNRYGGAGKYDAGKYETYIFGRTHVAGETLTGYYSLTDELVLQLEHGVGVKLEPPPLVSGLPDPMPPYLPYPGPEQQGTTLVHHAHAGLSVSDALQFAGHYLTTWTDDARLASELDGRITVLGGEVRLDAGFYGIGFLGYSHLQAEDVMRIAESLEVLHSNGGWNLRDNYFGHTATGTGTVDTIALQYTYSLATLLWHPEKFWGQGPDVLLSVFGMYNMVNSDDEEFNDPEQKLKMGGEVTYTMLSWLAASARYDLVQPDLDDNTLSFQALSPRLIVRTAFVSHEQVVLQYTRYFYGDNVRTAWPHVGLPPDRDVFQIAAIMWW